MNELENNLSFNTYFVATSPEDAVSDLASVLINIEDIQPIESYLIREHVDYHMNNLKKIFDPGGYNQRIVIKKSDNQLFKYHVVTGDARLYALHKSGVIKLHITPDFNFHYELVSDIPGIDPELELPVSNYEEGIRSFSDFDDKIVSEEEYDRLMEKRYGNKDNEE